MRDGLKAWVAALIGIMGMPAALAAGNVEAGQTKAAVCMGCHGPDGNSPADMWPKIAGQLPQYISKQLQDFKSGRRKNEQMSPMAQPLGDQDIDDLAAFFSAQKASKLEAKQRELLAEGEKIYMKGKGRPDVVPACLGCHGPSGSGKNDWSATMSRPPTMLAPAIGGQHPAYVVNQLKAYNVRSRTNDEAHVMRDIAGRLTDNDMVAVAQYIATLAR